MKTGKLTIHNITQADIDAINDPVQPKPALDLNALTNGGSVAVAIRDEAGKSIGIGGVLEYWQGVGEAWMLLDADCRANYRRDILIVSKMVIAAAFNKGFRRVQATASLDEHRRFLKWLGFCEEGKLLSYGLDGSDAWIYGKISQQ